MPEQNALQQITRDLQRVLADYNTSIRGIAKDIRLNGIRPFCDEHGVIFRPVSLTKSGVTEQIWAFYTRQGLRYTRLKPAGKFAGVLELQGQGVSSACNRLDLGEELTSLLTTVIPNPTLEGTSLHLGDLVPSYEGPELSIDVLQTTLDHVNEEAQAAQDKAIKEFAEQVRENLLVPFCDKHSLNFAHDFSREAFYFCTHDKQQLHSQVRNIKGKQEWYLETRDQRLKSYSCPENTRLMELLNTKAGDNTLATYVREYDSW